MEGSVALVKAGFLGAMPQTPSLAISLRTLELLYTIHLFRPSFSVEAFTKVLGQDIENYRVLHSCPPCSNQLKDKPPLEFPCMFVVDGNNSLKQMVATGGRQTADAQIFGESDYFLSKEFVDQYVDEVPSRHEEKPGTISNMDSKTGDFPPDSSGGDPTDGQDLESVLCQCTNNWKAADKESVKKIMWDGFHECGIFTGACRHGFILWIADIIHSGELAKYPLALVAKALQVFDEGFMLGYDIGSSFSETIASTSLNNPQCFHHTHIKGMGLEDLETMEHIFSLLNQLASVTRYMSPYCRRVFIDLYFQQWDRDKYTNLATMLYNNYCQALGILENNAVQLANDLKQMNLTKAKLEQLWEDQHRCFQQLGEESIEDVRGVEYIELLQKLRDLEASLERSHSSFTIQAPEDFSLLLPGASYNINLLQTRKQGLWEVTQMEAALDISRHWNPLDAEYKAALQYMTEHKYCQALENLHLLIVKHLFEMHKLNISGTGYKMRTHIASGLQCCAKAIRNAVKECNKYAIALDPPCDMLDWTKVTHFSFIDQFDILRDTRHNVLEEHWAQPVYRELMNQLHKVTRAREEIQCCNVEIHRLHTSIVDEEKVFKATLVRLTGTKAYGPVLDYISSHRQVNKLLCACIQVTYELPEFTGTPSPGETVKPMYIVTDAPSFTPSPSAGTCPPQFSDDQSDKEGPVEDDDKFVDTMERVVDFVVNLSL
ncbi:hypothetical protein BDP27DRAFT_1534881 [Rhodocollybia butyracea]|uniref:Uncharacterized protein n=1 Tax=Rhodocollybia butyracea TaxID=206335 RepID=A0A9P5U5A2_9AGAR|nr:hypothetical protein BDP27DRAFT_1534881 [Rhodocollybia butyracea]